MDELLREFLTETAENLDHVDAQLVRFEREPNNGQVLSNIFRLVHTIKGTCGFLGLPRLEALTHAAETLMGKFRDGMAVTGKELVTWGPPFLMACLPAALIIAPIVLKDRARLPAYAVGRRASQMNRLTPRLNPTHERNRGQKTTR